MTNTTVTTHEKTEEIAGRRLAGIKELSHRLGHSAPHKLYRENGVWVGVFKRLSGTHVAA